MHLAVLIVDSDILLQAFSNQLIGYHYFIFADLGIHHDFEDVQKLAGIASALTEKGFVFFYCDLLLSEHFVFTQSPLKENVKVFRLQALQDVNLASGKKGSDNLKTGILGGCSNQHYGSGFNCA